jgi:hypothetical protein
LCDPWPHPGGRGQCQRRFACASWGTLPTSEPSGFTKDYVYFLFNSSTTFRGGQDQATDVYFLAEQYVMAINALNQPME